MKFNVHDTVILNKNVPPYRAGTKAVLVAVGHKFIKALPNGGTHSIKVNNHEIRLDHAR